jgi:hypothetical protein
MNKNHHLTIASLPKQRSRSTQIEASQIERREYKKKKNVEKNTKRRCCSRGKSHGEGFISIISQRGDSDCREISKTRDKNKTRVHTLGKKGIVGVSETKETIATYPNL